MVDDHRYLPSNPAGLRSPRLLWPRRAELILDALDIVVPAPGHVLFDSHHGFRPYFCEAADPESKGVVEHLVGYAKTDLIAPGAPWSDPLTANRAAIAWCELIDVSMLSAAGWPRRSG